VTAVLVLAACRAWRGSVHASRDVTFLIEVDVACRQPPAAEPEVMMASCTKDPACAVR